MALKQLKSNNNPIPSEEPTKNLMEMLVKEINERKIPAHSSAIVVGRTLREINENYQHCLVISMMVSLFYKRYPDLKKSEEKDLYAVKDICQVAHYKEGFEFDFDNEQQRRFAYSAGQRLIVQETVECPITEEEVESLIPEAASWCLKYFPVELSVVKSVSTVVAAMDKIRAKADNPEYLNSLPSMSVAVIGVIIDEYKLYLMTSELMREISAVGVNKEEVGTEVAIYVSANENYVSLVEEMIAKYK